MKIGLFTDAHYCHAESLDNTRRPSLSLMKIKEAMGKFKNEKVDACFCLGDLTDHAPEDSKENVVSCFKEALSLILSYNIPFYFVPGNHDYLMMSGSEVEKELKQSLPPKIVSFDEYDFIMLDANYRTSGKRFDEEGVVWTDSNLPKWQVDFLSDTLKKSQKKCIVMIHENLDPNIVLSHLVKNGEVARKVIKDSGKVKMVIQGHYHRGANNIVDGIQYLTVPAMCEGTKNSFLILDL